MQILLKNAKNSAKTHFLGHLHQDVVSLIGILLLEIAIFFLNCGVEKQMEKDSSLDQTLAAVKTHMLASATTPGATRKIKKTHNSTRAKQIDSFIKKYLISKP